MNTKPNRKPFWKEKSFTAIWKRLNDGGKVIVLTFLYLVVLGLFARYVSEIGALWILAFSIGFSCGYIFKELSLPYKE